MRHLSCADTRITIACIRTDLTAFLTRRRLIRLLSGITFVRNGRKNNDTPRRNIHNLRSHAVHDAGNPLNLFATTMSDQKRFFIGICKRHWECRVENGKAQVLHDGNWISADKLIDHLTPEEFREAAVYGFKKYKEALEA